MAYKERNRGEFFFCAPSEALSRQSYQVKSPPTVHRNYHFSPPSKVSSSLSPLHFTIYVAPSAHHPVHPYDKCWGHLLYIFPHPSHSQAHERWTRERDKTQNEWENMIIELLSSPSQSLFHPSIHSSSLRRRSFIIHTILQWSNLTTSRRNFFELFLKFFWSSFDLNRVIKKKETYTKIRW